jgi:hypothetical protein
MTPHFKTAHIASIAIFSALWITLNLTLGPLNFKLLGLPILCDFAVFFPLLLVTWTTNTFGTAATVGIIGSIPVLLINPSPHIIGFMPSVILFDILMTTNKHQRHPKIYNMITAALATAASAYLAGTVIGMFFTGNPLNPTTIQWALTFWGGWHLTGGIMTVTITLPIIGILDKANVRKIQVA